ncbi:InlB B-repeat-containing protein [Agathobaculum sp. NTUH-O15-33]|uniref:InlB B-repeat-containing protein n=1 Tax=Agathobaculum sp. NTUH-O15-33 TaxID=3079302 RepID=UPI0029584A37|nr:InlB B-repeat-containing protein [Agathobaculum sp. NTUH-O15-33]WNX83351.1 InlB B-repeat-containing protein [Agathobaculum sp. NTUH-O15-33]
MKIGKRLLKCVMSMGLLCCILIGVMPIQALADWNAWTWQVEIKPVRGTVHEEYRARDMVRDVIPEFSLSFAGFTSNEVTNTGRKDYPGQRTGAAQPLYFKATPNYSVGAYQGSIISTRWNGQHIGNLDCQGGTVLLATFQGLYVDRVNGDTMNLDYHTGALTHTSTQCAQLWCATVRYAGFGDQNYDVYCPAKWVDGDGEDSINIVELNSSFHNVPRLPASYTDSIGKKVVAWTEHADGSGEEFQFETTFLDHDITLYPKYKTIAPFTLTLDLNDSASGNGTTKASLPSDYEAKYGNSFTMQYYQKYGDTNANDLANGEWPYWEGDDESGWKPESSDIDLPHPTREGYKFIGWADESGQIVGNKDRNMSVSNCKLYAQWEPEAYTVQFDRNGGDKDGSITSTKVKFDQQPEPVGIAIGETLPEKKDKFFKGYYTAPNGGDVYFNDIGNSVRHWTIDLTPDREADGGTKTLYAQWRGDEYPIVLNGQGAKVQPVTEVTAEYNEILPAIPQDGLPIKEGYSFGGYYTKTDGGGEKIYNADGSSTKKWSTRAGTTLYAKWEAAKTTVTLDPQGGQQSGPTIHATYNEPIAAITPPIRQGYTFLGYNDQSSNTYIGPNGNGLRPWDKIDATYTLNAQWKANTYNLVVDPQNESSAIAQTVTYDTAMPSFAKPEKTGSVFEGYFTKTEDGAWGEKVYDASARPVQSIWNYPSDLNLFAKWNPIKYKLTLDKNTTEAIDWHGGAATHDIYYGELYPSLPSPTRKGYVFTGWYSNAVCGPKDLVRGGFTKVTKAENQTLYAGWEPLQIRVTYVLAEDFLWEKIIDYGQPYGEQPNLSSDGQVLKGWYVDPEDAATQKKKTDTVDVEYDHRLYPVYTGKTYDISFSAALSGVSNPKKQSATVGEKYGTLPTLTDPAGNNTFAGWYLEKDYRTQVTADTVVSEAEAHTLYAKWVRGQLVIAFDPQGGSACVGRTIEFDHAFGDLPVPTRKGYAFKGWYQNAAGTGTAATATDKASNTGNGTLTLYAKWTPITVPVTFKTTLANTSISGSTMTQQFADAKYDQTYGSLFGGTIPAPNNGTGGAYTFTGWFTDMGWKIENDTKISSLEGHTITAGWRNNQATIILNENGGVLDSSVQAVNVRALNSSLTLPGADKVSRTGYTFLGWSQNQTASTPDSGLTPGSYKPTSTETIVLYAVWKVNQGYYQVQHYQQQPNGDYTVRETESPLERDAGTLVSAQAKTYPGYQINYRAANTVASGTVEAGKTLTLKLYYDLDIYSAVMEVPQGYQVEVVTGQTIGRTDSGNQDNAFDIRRGGTLAFRVKDAAGNATDTPFIVQVNGTEVKPAADGIYKISMDGPKSVVIGVEQIYHVRAKEGETGYRIVAVPENTEFVAHGNDYSFTVKLDPQYSQSSIKVTTTPEGGSSQELTARDGVYTIPSVKADHTVSVTGLTLNRYQVTYGTGSGYTIAKVDATTVPYNGSHSFTVTVAYDCAGAAPVVRANGGKALDPIRISGTTYTYKLEAIREDQHITVDALAAHTHTVSYEDSADYRIVPIDGMSNPVAHGGMFAFTFDFSAAYQNASPIVIATGSSGKTEKLTSHGSTYYLWDITEDTKLTFENMTTKTCKVNVVEGYGYTVEPLTTGNVVGYGGTYMFALQLNGDYAEGDPDVRANNDPVSPKIKLDDQPIYVYSVGNVITDTKVTVELPDKKTFAISWVVDGKTTTENVEEGEIPLFGSVPQKESTGSADFVFQGWKDASGKIYTGQLPPVSADATYTAVFGQTERKYQVLWSVNGAVTSESYLYGAAPEFTGETERPEDSQYRYTFTGWSDGKKTYAPGAALPLVSGPVTYTAQYEIAAREYELTVQYQYANGSTAAPEKRMPVAAGETYSADSPNISGYTPTQQTLTGTMPSTDLNLTVVYYSDSGTPYKVVHKKQELSGAGYVMAETEQLRGTPGEQTEAVAKAYEGFTAQGFSQTAINRDGMTEIEIKYNRNSYEVKWDPNGGYFNDAGLTTAVKSETYQYGETINEPEVRHASEAANSFTFAGWNAAVPQTMPAGSQSYTAYWTPSARVYTVKVSFVDQDGKAIGGAEPVSGKFAVGSDYYLSGFPAVSGKTASQTSVSGVMPASNVNVTVVYYDESTAATYTVEHYLAGTDGTYGAAYETETRTGFADRQTSETGKNYDGYTVDHVEQATVTADGKAVVKAYYARRYYTVTWDAGGGTFPGGAANELTSVRYGAAVSAPTAPTKAADANYTYTFSGWYPSVAGEMPSYDVTYTAQYIRTPRTYTLTVQYLYADGTQAKQAVVKENMSVGESYRIASPEVSGYAANRTVVTGVMPASDTTETVTYVSTSGVEYTVKHVREAVGGDIEETEVLRGTTGAQTSALPRSYDGYTAQKVQQTTIRADGTAAVEIRYTRNSYQVVWNGNGGTIGGQKTVTRTVKYGETLTPPSTPVKNGDAQFGYAFAGWEPSVPQTMPAGDQTFFATWSAVQNQYTLTVHYKKADGGEAAPSKSEVYTVGQNYTVSSPAVEGMTPNLETVTGIMPAADTEITVTYYPNNATRYTVKHLQKDAAGEGYTLAETEYLRGTAGEQTKAAAKTYAGFKKPSSVTQQTISSETETVVEIQYERESYTVTWNAGDGQFDGNAATKISTVKYGAAITGAPTPTKAADDLFTYRFTGWSPSVADTMPAWDVAYTAQYERTAKPYTLTVLYRFADGTTAHEPHREQVSTGGSYNVESPSIEGYAPNQSVVTGTMPAKDTEILVTYVSTKGVTYKVQHLLEQEDGTYGPIKDEQVQRGQPGAQTAAVPKIYEGYTAGTPEQQTILANGNTTVQIKYARNGYQVTWNAAGGKVNGEDRWTQTVKYGASITKPADPTRTSDAGYAYTFGGWDAEIPETMPAGDLSFTAKWNTNRQTYRLTVRYQYENGTEAHASQDYQFIVGESYEIKDIPAVEGYRPNVTSVKGTMPAQNTVVTVLYYPETGTQYTVKHLLQPVSGEAYELADTETLRGETGKESKAAARSYPGFTAQRVVQKPIAADGSTLVEVRYTRNEYTVTWNAGEGAFSGGEKSKTATYRYGAAIDRPTNLTRPADANFDYVFTGWTPEVPETMPPQNVTYTAQYGRAAQSYQLTVTYKMGDGTAAPEAHQETVTAGRSYRVVSPKVEGYTPSIAIVTGTMPSHDTEVLVTYYSNQGVQYKVVHKLQNLNGTAYEQADFDLLYGQTGTQTRAEPRVYTGFTPQAIEQQTVNADGGTVVEILYTRNSYKVTWNGAGGKVNGEDETIQSVKYGGSITSPTRLAKDEDVNYSYRFSKWDKAIPSEMPAKDLYFIAQWDTDERSYEVTVSYQNKDGSEAFEDISDVYAIGKDYAIYTPEKEGYFPSLETVTGTMPANDLAFTVTYFPNTDAKYIVKHVLEPLPDMPMLLAMDDTDGIVYVEETMGGTVDEETQARPMPIPGFTAETYTQETIGGDTVVTIRYKRNEYDVVWDGNGGKWGEDETQTTTLLYGQRIAEPEEPTREADANSGYTFLSWGAKLPETMPAENLTYVARWSTAARDYTYTVKFVCEDGATAPEPITGTLAAGSAYTFTDFPALDGYVAIPNSLTGIMPASDLTLTVTYYPSAMGVPYKVEQYMEQADGSYKAEKTEERIGIAGQMTAETAEELAHYTARPVEQQKILGSGETVVKIYYERKAYTVTFDGNGGTLEGAASVRGKWGAAVTAPTATREGYTFEGWLPAFSGTIPQADATYQAQWKTNSGGGTGGGDSGGGGAGGGGGGATGPAEPDKPGTDDAGFTPCDGGESCPTKGTFLDNPYGSWYHDYVDYVFANGLMKGVSSDRFAPDETLTRGMLVTILYRMAGSPAVSGASPFADVAEGKWYTDAILWATQTDVAGGYGNDRFGPDDPITREQTAAILYRYAVLKGFDTDGRAELSGFTDANEVSAWAREAMQWCVQKSLITGRTEQELAPAGTATRAEIAAILSRYCGQVAK